MDNSSIHHLGYPPNLHPRTTSHIIERQPPTSTNIPESTLHGNPMPRKEKKNINVGQSDMMDDKRVDVRTTFIGNQRLDVMSIVII